MKKSDLASRNEGSRRDHWVFSSSLNICSIMRTSFFRHLDSKNWSKEQMIIQKFVINCTNEKRMQNVKRVQHQFRKCLLLTAKRSYTSYFPTSMFLTASHHQCATRFIVIHAPLHFHYFQWSRSSRTSILPAGPPAHWATQMMSRWVVLAGSLMTSKVYKLPLQELPKQEVKMCGQHVPSFLWVISILLIVCIEIQMWSAKSKTFFIRYRLNGTYVTQSVCMYKVATEPKF